MHIEIERGSSKVTLDAPSAKTPAEIREVVDIAKSVLDDMSPSAPPPLPFGFSVWADAERRPSIEYAEQGRDGED